MTARSGRLSSAWWLGGALLVLVGCGGGGDDSPTAPTPFTPVPAAPATSVVGQGSAGLPSRFLLFVPFTTSGSGTIGLTVDWTSAANDVDVYLARGNNPCTVEQFNAAQCSFLGFSESTTAKPETVSVPNLTAGTYTMYIGNFGATDESVAYQVTLTTTSTASPSANASSARATVRRAAGGKGAVTRSVTRR